MTDFESMTDDEYAKHLCAPVRLTDYCVRQYASALDCELVDDYRKQLTQLDRYCMEPVE